MAEKKQFQISDDYKEVAERIDDLYDKYPKAVLRGSWDLQVMGEFAYIVYTAECVREPGEEASIGTAMEQIPGTTPYTKGSEIQNAETSAWGRAIVAAGASRSKRIASADEIRSAEARRSADSEPAPEEWIVKVEAALNSVPDKLVRATMKRNFAAAFAPPRELRKSQMHDVEAVLAQNKLPLDGKVSDPAAAAGPDADAAAAPTGRDDSESPRGTETEPADVSSGSGAGGEPPAAVGSSSGGPPASTSADGKPATAQQKRTLGIRFAELVKGEFLAAEAKDEIVGSLTGGRTTTRTELTFDEAVKLIALTHQIQAGSVSVTVGDPAVPLLVANNAVGDKFMESWPKAEVPA